VVFGGHGRIFFLDGASVSGPQAVSVSVKKRGPDGNPAFGKTQAGFFDSNFQHLLVRLVSSLSVCWHFPS
jgi:hypothetical protein